MKCQEECFDRKPECNFMNVGLVGNPNSGKSTIFNALTGEKQHIANYPGVTVDIKRGCFDIDNKIIRISDLPGIYSLTAMSEDEAVSRALILDNKPDVLLNVVDSTNLQRQLYLTVQLLELGMPLVCILNKSDEAKELNININVKNLEKELGCQIIRTIGTKKVGLKQIGKSLLNANKSNGIDFKIDYGEIIESYIEKLQKSISEHIFVENSNTRWLSIKLLENDSDVLSYFERNKSIELIKDVKTYQAQLEKHFQQNCSQIMISKRYSYLHTLIEKCVEHNEVKRTRSDRIDNFLTNPFIGFPIFLVVMWMLFEFTFVVGDPIVGWIEEFFSYIANTIDANMVDGWFKSLLVDGIIAGVGAVFVFLPNIALLFFGISILEYSGYISRAAFIMDRMMQRIGLQGKSFIPMIIGFGCTIPALMATRVMDNKRDKLLTMLIIPFMSCGAKLPVYLILAGTFFPNHAGLVIFFIYLFGIFVGILAALILRKTIIRGRSMPFLLEMPKYKVPDMRRVLGQTGYRSWLYIRKIGTVILGASIILWFVMSYPGISAADRQIYETKINASQAKLKQYEKDNPQILLKENTDKDEKSDEVREYNKLKEDVMNVENDLLKKDTENTIGGYVGKGLGFIMIPNGFGSWQVGTALFSGIAAKEIIVSSLSTTYSLGQDSDEESVGLREALKDDENLSNISIIALMVFVLLYTPCFGSVITFKVESKSWGWTIFMVFFTFGIAWIMSFLVFQIGSLLV